MRRIAAVLGLIFMCGANCAAQNLNSGDYFIEGGVRYGFVLNFPSDLTVLHNLWNESAEIRFGLQTRGEDSWERPLGLPIIGSVLRLTTYTDWLSSPAQQQEQQRILGKNIALFGYVEAPFLRRGWFTWTYQFGVGLSYFTKIYDAQTNPENVLISAHVSPYISLQSGINFRLGRRFEFLLNASFSHASNGARVMPNWGINEVAAIASVRYHLNSKLPQVQPVQEADLGKRNALIFGIDQGWLWARYNNYYYNKWALSFGYERRLLPYLRAGSALDVLIATSIAPTREYRPDQPQEVPNLLVSYGISGFGDLTFGRFIMQLGVGVYTYCDPDRFNLEENGGSVFHQKHWFYEYLGFKFEMGKSRRHSIGFRIRAHVFTADYAAITYGVRIWRF